MSIFTEGIVLDTSAAIRIFRKQLWIEDIAAGDFQVFLPSIVLGELYFGAEKSLRRAQELARIRSLLEEVAVLQPDEAAAEAYGKIAAGLARTGTPIPTNDMWVAAAAIAAEMPLVTSDPHFDRIEDLQIIRC